MRKESKWELLFPWISINFELFNGLLSAPDGRTRQAAGSQRRDEIRPAESWDDIDHDRWLSDNHGQCGHPGHDPSWNQVISAVTSWYEKKSKQKRKKWSRSNDDDDVWWCLMMFDDVWWCCQGEAIETGARKPAAKRAAKRPAAQRSQQWRSAGNGAGWTAGTDRPVRSREQVQFSWQSSEK